MLNKKVPLEAFWGQRQMDVKTNKLTEPNSRIATLVTSNTMTQKKDGHKKKYFEYLLIWRPSLFKIVISKYV